MKDERGGNSTGNRVVSLAIFLPNLAGGGAERAMVNLASAFCEQGHEVELVLGSVSGELLAEVPKPVRVVDLGARRMSVAWWALFRYLRRTRPLALMSTLEHANVLSLMLAPFVPATRVIIREANTASMDVDRKSLPSRLTLVGMKLLYSRAHSVIAVSQGVATELQTRLGVRPERVRTIANPVLTPRMYKQAQEPPNHPWFGDGGAPIILAVGRLAVQKGFDVLLEALSEVMRVRDARLIILGEGPLRAELENLTTTLGLDGSVSMPGFVLNPFSYMSRADVFVLPSRWEGLPNALIQAVALGAPAVATDCRSGPMEILEGGMFGHLVPVEEPEALAEAILAALAGDRRPAAQGWAEKYRSDVVVRQYAKALGIQ